MSVNSYVSHARDSHGQAANGDAAFMAPAKAWSTSKAREEIAAHKHAKRIKRDVLKRTTTHTMNRAERKAWRAERARDAGATLTRDDYRRTPSVKPSRVNLKAWPQDAPRPLPAQGNFTQSHILTATD